MPAILTRTRLRETLGDVAFPADKDQLIEAARRHHDDEAERALRAVPPAEYENMTEVIGAVDFDEDAAVPGSSPIDEA